VTELRELISQVGLAHRVRESDQHRAARGELDPGFEHWLLKFDGMGRDKELGPSQDYGRIEYAYHLMARDAGIDTRQAGWMDDPRCESNWTALIVYRSVGGAPGAQSSIVMEATVDLTVATTGAVSGAAAGRAVVTASVPPPCTVTFDPAVAPVRVGGRLQGDTFDLLVSWDALTTTGTSRCQLPFGEVVTPVPIPWPAFTGIPVRVVARGGEQGTDPGGSVTVTLLNRR